MKLINTLLLLFFSLNIYAQFIVNFTAKNVTYCNASNGAITSKISGKGIPPFTFKWSNGATQANISNLNAGTYCVTVTDFTCCSASTCVEVKDESKQLTFNTISSTTPASSCGVADGTITLTQITANGVAPYTYEWFKVGITGNTSIGTGQNPAILKNLLQGVYYVVAKDANGCKGSSPDFFVLAPNNIAAKFDEIRPCTGQSNGQLTAIITNAKPNEIFSFTWNNGLPSTLNGLSSTQKNLKAGLYTVEIKRTGVPAGQECPRVFKYELKTDNFQASNITAKIKNVCKGKNNGTIALDYGNFGTPFTVAWADPIPVSKKGAIAQFNLFSGSYTVSVTNKCGNKAVKTFEVKEAGSVPTITVKQNDDCTTDLTAELANATEPIRYFWTYGKIGTTKTILDVEVNSAHVTVTDANGCGGVANFDEVPYYSISQKDACAGANGFAVVHIHNPANKSMSVNALVGQQLTPFDTKFFPENHHIFGTGKISGPIGTTIPIEIAIGNCKTTENITFNSLPTVKAFEKFKSRKTKDKLCYYSETCDGVSIKDGNKKLIFEEPALFKIVNCSKYKFCTNFKDPNSPIKIGRVKGDGNSNWVKGKQLGDFLAFLESEIVNNPSKALFAKTTSNDIKHMISLSEIRYAKYGTPLPTTYCHNVTYCPDTYEYSLPFTTNIKLSIDVLTPVGDCWEYSCGGVTKVECPPKNTNNIDTTNTATTNNCNSIQLPFAQLYVWYDDLITYPGFDGSELKDLLDKYKDNKKATCAYVRYCQKDFSVLSYDKVDKIECPQYDNGIFSSTKTCTYADTTDGIITILCLNSFNKFGTGFSTNSITITLDPKYKPFFRPVTDSRVLSSHIPTIFEDFSYVSSDGKKQPNATIKSEEGTSYYNFQPVSHKMNMFETDENATNFFDFDTQEDINIYAFQDNEDTTAYWYTLDFEGKDESSWSVDFTADYFDVKNLKKSEDLISLAGFFQGNLYFEEQVIRTSKEKSAYTMYFDRQGNFIDIQVLENTNEQNTTFYEYGNGFAVSGISKNEPNILYNIDFQTQKEISKVHFDGDLMVHKAIKSTMSNNFVYLLSANGSDVQIGPSTIPNGNFALVSFDEKGEFQWQKSISSEKLESNLIDFIIDKNDNIYLSTTFDGVLQQEKQTFKSQGKRDIVITKLDNKGNITATKQYGSVDDEIVRRIEKVDDLIIFGGEVAGATKKRTIGATNFLCLNLVEHEAYMSYMTDNDFDKENIPVDTKTQKYNVSTIKTDFDVQIYPNPFNNNLNININCAATCDYEVRITNTLGSVLWQKKAENAKGNTLFEVEAAQRLVNGVYFVEVKSSEGKTAVYRVVKN